MVKIFNNNKGISIVEILIVSAIISITLVSFLSAIVFSLKTSRISKQTIRAKEVASASIEAVRNFRDNVVWNNDDLADEYDGLGVVNTGTAYHPEESTGSPSQWKLIQGADEINGYNREVFFENVSRDPISDDIEEIYNPVNNDPDTKKVIVNVSWQNRKIEIITYFTNWRQ